MGMWNPYLVNMEDIEERYGKVVYYDEMDVSLDKNKRK